MAKVILLSVEETDYMYAILDGEIIYAEDMLNIDYNFLFTLLEEHGFSFHLDLIHTHELRNYTYDTVDTLRSYPSITTEELLGKKGQWLKQLADDFENEVMQLVIDKNYEIEVDLLPESKIKNRLKALPPNMWKVVLEGKNE